MVVKPDYAAMGRRLHALREYRQLTQESLAHAVGESVEYIDNLENGRSACSADTLVAISCALQISIDYLLADSLPAGGFQDPPFQILRSTGSIFCNTLSDWLLEGGCFCADMPVDLASLPPIPFMALDDAFN